MARLCVITMAVMKFIHSLHKSSALFMTITDCAPCRHAGISEYKEHCVLRFSTALMFEAKRPRYCSRLCDLHREMFCVRFVAAFMSFENTVVRGVREMTNSDR